MGEQDIREHSDVEVVAQALRGSQEAFHELVRRF